MSSSPIAWRARWASRLAFVPIDRERMAEQLEDGYCDLVMSGVVVTTDRAREILFSDSYLDETSRSSCLTTSASVTRAGTRFALAAR